jgi:hypothetical protein
MLRVASRNASISSNHSPIDPTPSFRLCDGFQASADGRRTALIDALGDEIVDLSEEFLGQPYCNLLCHRTLSIPLWDAQRYASHRVEERVASVASAAPMPCGVPLTTT